MKRLLLVALACPSLLAAQGLRISGVTTVQYVELRQLVIDSILTSGNRISAAPVLQDLTLSGWGWREGLSFHANLRARTQLGSTDGLLYPRADRHLDAIDAYAELDRSTWRGRLGRQWITSGLGSYAFDGANALLRHEEFSVEGWGGRALLAGLNDPYTSAQLAAVDNLPPPQDGYIVGGRARYRPSPLLGTALTYQRVLLADRSGLYAERASFDASSRAYAVTADLGLNYDFATGDFNEARLRLGASAGRTIGYSVEVRHSRPYFELWTIWGAFSPIGFDEERATVDWGAPGSPFSASLRGAFRKYADAGTAVPGVRTNGWRAGGDVRWQNATSLSAFGSYDVDIGSGAASTDVRTGGHWSRSDDMAVGVDLAITQNIYEFRVGTGRILGAALNGAMRIAPDARLVADIGVYQHVLTNGAPGPDWTQRRAALRFEWTMGRDPGMAK
ncbi:MAG: hypothetical protein V4550_14660 [Gemmatimonadota bacterium]